MIQILLDPQKEDKTSGFLSRIIFIWQNKLCKYKLLLTSGGLGEEHKVISLCAELLLFLILFSSVKGNACGNSLRNML